MYSCGHDLIDKNKTKVYIFQQTRYLMNLARQDTLTFSFTIVVIMAHNRNFGRM